MDSTMLDGAEKKLQEWYKGAPNLPKNVNTWIAKYAWIFVTIGAVLMVLAAMGLLAALGVLGTTTGVYGYETVRYSFFGWIAFVALVVYIFYSFKAVAPLKEQSSEGWKRLFYLEFFYVGYSFLQWLAAPAYIGNLFGVIIGALIGFYFLFQIKEYFK